MAVGGTRSLTKQDMLLNSATPEIEVNPENFRTRVDGRDVELTPARSIALGQLYWFS